MQLFRFLRRFAVVLPAMGLLGRSSTGISTPASPEPEKLIAEIPIHESKLGDVTYFLPVTIHGHAATLFVNLASWGDLGLSPDALKRLGVTLTDTTQLDSLTIGPVTEHNVVMKRNWRVNVSKLQVPPNLPPVVGAVGVKFMSYYDVLYDYPSHRVRLYARPKHPVNPRDAWLPPGIKPTDCGRMVHVPPPGAGTYTGVEMQLDGHPVIAALETISTGEKMNPEAVAAMGLTDSSPRIQPLQSIAKQVMDVHMTIGSNMFWKGPVMIFPVAVGELFPNKPVILISLSTIDSVVLFSSNSSEQVCVGKP